MGNISIDVTINCNTQRVNFTCNGTPPQPCVSDFSDDFSHDFGTSKK